MVAVIFALLSVATLAEIIYSTIFLQLYLQRRSIIYLYFMIFTGIAIFWSFGTALMLFARSTPLVYTGYWMFLIAPMLSTLFILYFCQQFIKGKTQPLYFLGVVGIVIYALVLAFSNSLLTIDFSANGLNALYPNKLFYLFYGLYFVVYFDISIFTLRQHKEEQDRTKYYQAKSILYGTGLTGTLGIFTNIALPAFGVVKLVWMGPLFSLIFLSFSTIAITRYKLLDIKGTILRSTSYAFTVIFLAGVYSAIIAGVFGQTLLSRDASTVQWIILSAMTATVAAVFAPLQRFFNKWTNKLFYRDAYDPQQLLSDLNSVLISTLDLNHLLNESAEIINSILKTEFCIFGIKETERTTRRIIGTIDKQFAEQDIASIRAITPNTKLKIIIADNLPAENDLRKLMYKYEIALIARLTETPMAAMEGTGYIILGGKKSGSPFSSGDVKVMEIITDELVIAIQNALRFEEIEQFNVTLQKKVDDATAELKQTNQKLRELDETKDEFISMASHQLRTPLTSVKGYVSMVLEGDAGKISQNQKDLLSQAFISSQRMVYLIADLLNVSRLKTGKFVIQAQPTQLADVIEGELSQLTETAKGRKLELTYEKPANFPLLMLDETKIRQVIMNFVDNAIYYTKAGGHIVVGLKDLGSTVEFTVTDDGIGVPKSEQHKLFSKFYRAGNAQKARPDGTGLGLFMAQKVVVAQGGAIIFKSEEGKGSTFGFKFDKAKLLAKPDSKPVTITTTAQPTEEDDLMNQTTPVNENKPLAGATSDSSQQTAKTTQSEKLSAQ